MVRFVLYFVLAFFFVQPTLASEEAQPGSPSSNTIDLGRLPNGSTVTFNRSNQSKWGIKVSGGSAPPFTQQEPAQIELYRSDTDIRDFAAGYESLKKEADGVVAKAIVPAGDHASFAVTDHWRIDGPALILSRTVSVVTGENGAGFYSAIHLVTDPKVSFADADYLAPGLLYGKPETRANAPGGSAFLNAKKFSIREDYLPAPLFGISFRDGRWVTVMDMAPKGDTTAAETTAQPTTPVIDERIRFGALGARELANGGIELGFWLPGTTDEFSGGFGFGGRPSTPVKPSVRHRYNPVRIGFTQTYQVGFRFGEDASIQTMERDAWRWAWKTLNPQMMRLNLGETRKALLDHIADRVLVVGDRAGLPFVTDSVSGKPGSFRPSLLLALNPRFRNQGAPTPEVEEIAKFAKSIGIDIGTNAAEIELWPKIMLGFCGKNIEAAGQFLMESDRDPSARGERLRKLGLMMIDSMVRIDTMSPAPAGEGFDIRTGKPSAVRGEPSFALRATAEDMRAMVDIIRRERTHSREHPVWFAWVKAYSDWLLTTQREDGSFPESFQGSTGKITGASGGTSYAAVPLLVRMAKEMKEKQYLDAAERAANYIWSNYGSKGVYVGATGGDVADKESGMLSMEAFLAIYENTKKPMWLDRARAAADYTESYIWLWNVPMAPDLPDDQLGWKHGVSTVGVTGIASNVPGEADEYLDWAAPTYAELYKYTHDRHYLDVARILVFNTKSMTALPGRTYDLLGPGWQQEHWRLGPGVRGIGAHRTWLPWISINHIHSITGLEELDPALYRDFEAMK